jgi:7-carboxy-7-deazaguanine synthase
MTAAETTETGLATRLAPSPAGTRRYAVKAIWRTVQGEGAWAGRPAVFVRLAGCNLWTGYEHDRARDAERSDAHCPLWCDTDFTREGAVRLSADDLAEEIARVAAQENPRQPVRFAVLTGGEPLLQADASLIDALHADGFEVACETNGTVSLAEAFAARDGSLRPPDWVVCSPKLPEDRLALEWCDELKLVVPDYRPDAYAGLAARVRQHDLGGRPRRFLWLQPEDGPRRAEATRLAVSLAVRNPDWRVSVQTHKILGVD